MRTTLIETSTIKAAFDEIKRLDDLFVKSFNRNSKVDLLIFSAGDPRIQLINGITMEWQSDGEKDAEFYKAQVTKQ